MPNLLETPSSLSLALDQIMDHGMTWAPMEACGILFPHKGRTIVVRLPNVSDNPESGYAIDPESLKNLKIRPSNWGEVIVWHTHPGGQVGPSSGDLEHAVPGVQYMVVTIPTGEWEGFRAE